MAQEKCSGPIFPVRIGTFKTRASEFLRAQCDIVDEGVTLHSCRHWWKTQTRTLLIPEVVANAIQGHSMPGSKSAAGYGEGPALTVLREWLEKVGVSR